MYNRYDKANTNMKRVVIKLKEINEKLNKKLLKSYKGVPIFYIIFAFIFPPVTEFINAWPSLIVDIFGVDESNITLRFFLSYPFYLTLAIVILFITERWFKH